MASQKITLWEKISYAFGDAAAGGITWKIMSIAFPLFFTNVFGLSFADAAALMLIARLFDVVTDPVMGSLADRTQSRWGTYRPWLIFGAIPFGLIFALLLYTPDHAQFRSNVYLELIRLIRTSYYTGASYGMNTGTEHDPYGLSVLNMSVIDAVDNDIAAADSTLRHRITHPVQ